MVVEGGREELNKLGLVMIDVIFLWCKLVLFWKCGKEMEEGEMWRRYEEGGVEYKVLVVMLVGK